MKQETKNYIKHLFVDKKIKSIPAMIYMVYSKKLEHESFGKLHAKIFKELQRLK